jgi:hypothetical protein
MANHNQNDNSLEQWLWDAACSIRGAKDVPKYKDYILPLVFTDKLNNLCKTLGEVGARAHSKLNGYGDAKIFYRQQGMGTMVEDFLGRSFRNCKTCLGCHK